MTIAKIAMASALALATAAPVYAQGYGGQTQAYPPAQTYGTPYRPTDEYLRQQQQYNAQSRQYDESQERYRESRADYRAARADYERRLTDWQAARAAYDARYGVGSYARIYPAPVWDESRWAVVVPPSHTVVVAPSAGYYGANTAYVAPIHCDNGTTIAGGLIGAAGGAAVGAGVGGGEGAVLGALVGGGIGAAVGHERDRYRCDAHGAYYSYQDTIPYREPDRYGDERYAAYQRMGCRLAPAPVNDVDYRYVRVCPDTDGRYRITG